MEKIKEIIKTHFDPQQGSAYWLDLAKSLDFDPCEDIKSVDDFYLLGAMDVSALRTRPITDFIPQQFHKHLSSMILAETGGTTGSPCRRVFSSGEFQAAFVNPWRKAVQIHNFPKGATWLFVGPGGPHVIAQAAREMAREVDSLEPFSVDCDVRWIKKQLPGSLGFILYLDHVMEQAMNCLKHQNITVLFTTPPLLLELASRMTSQQRLAIRGIHTGGMFQDVETTIRLRDLFPGSVILPGYGNSLLGVMFERWQKEGEESVFFIGDPSLSLQIIPLPKTEDEPPLLRQTLPPGETGRIVAHRLDKSFMLINMLERDTARYDISDYGDLGITGIGTLNFTALEKTTGVY